MLKTLERVLRKRILNHLEAKKLMIAEHHGFCRKRSNMTNVIGLLDEVTSRIDKGERVKFCYLDFQKVCFLKPQAS